MEPQQQQPFSCEMCLSKFNEVNRIPYLLPTCGHTMCASCLTTFLLSNPSGPFTCPFDSTEYQIDHSGINNFPKNHALLTAMRQDQNMSNPPFVPFVTQEQTPRKERTKSLCISSTSSCSSLNAIDKEDQQTASEELQLVVTNKLGHLEQALSQIEAFEQKIYDHVEEAVMTKEKHILELLDQKFAEFHAILDNKKKEMIDRVTLHFNGVRERVKNKQNPRESQYEAKTKVIEWKNIVKKKMSLWNKVKTVEVANEIIEEDETAMVPEVNLWTSRIENVLSLGNLDKLVDKSFMVFDEEGASKAIAALCEFKVMNEESFEKENVFGSAEKSVPKEENSKTDSDTSSPQDMTDRRKFISQLFKAYGLKVDPTFAKEVDKLKIKPKNNPLLLPATSKDKKKKKFMFENFDEFERLHIHCEDFKDKNLSNLAQVLQFFNMLKDLHIILIGCDKVHDISLETLGTTLQGLPNLQSLTVEYLSPSPKITDQGLIKFAKKISGSQTLQKISLSFEKLSGATEKGFTNIWDDLALVTSGLTNVKLVVPADVIVTDEGLGRLSVGLKQMTKLQEFELVFNGNDKLSNKGFSQLSESLGKLVNLTVLRITAKEQSGNINDRGFSSFIQALAKLVMLKDLSLELPKCYVSNEKFIEFCQALSKLNFLKQLNLNFSWSLLSDGSLMELGKAVACLYSITDLHLDFTACSFSNTGFKELTAAISGLFNLHQLSLDFSWCKDITDEGLLHLVEGISKLSNLNKLEVNLKEARKITESSVMRLCKAVPRSSSIEHLVLNVVNCGRDLNDEAKMRMEDALSTGRRYVNRKISVAE